MNEPRLTDEELIAEARRRGLLVLPVSSDLRAIRTLYRSEDGAMILWGLPYTLLPGSSPRHLLRDHGAPSDWVYLGSPGWWGSLRPERIDEVRAWLRTVEHSVPARPGEWCEIDRVQVAP